MCSVGSSQQPALATTAQVGSVLGGVSTSANPTRAAARSRGSLLAGTVGRGVGGAPGSGGGGGGGGGYRPNPGPPIQQR